MTASVDEAGSTADVALILVGPLDDLYVPRTVLHRCDSRIAKTHGFHLIGLGVITRMAGDSNGLAVAWMYIVPVTAAPASVDEPCPLQVSYQFSDLRRHEVLRRSVGLNAARTSRTRPICRSRFSRRATPPGPTAHRPARPRIRFCLNSAIFVLHSHLLAAHARVESSTAALTHGAALTQTSNLFTVIETPAFTRLWPDYWDEDERGEFVAWLVENAEIGDVIRDSGGCRKVRWKRAGRGKRGGVRVIYYNRIADEMIYLLLIYAKGVRDDIDAKTLDRIRRTLDGEDD